MNKKILLSTDIGSDIDDALSLLVMLNHSNIDLRGIYTVNGDVDSRSRIAKHMIDLAGKDIPVARGTSQPVGALVKPYTYSDLEKTLVNDKFIDFEKMERKGTYDEIIKPLKETGINTNGVKHLAEQLSKDKHTIFSIGPMTDIAQLLRKYPSAAKNIDKIYAMAGYFPANDKMEHNFRFDSTAAREVLASDIPITLVPSDVCSLYSAFFDELRDNFETPAGAYVKHMLLAYIGSKLIQEINSYQERYSTLVSLLKDLIPHNICNLDEFDRLKRNQNYFINNLDIETAYYEPEKFWEDFEEFNKQLENPKYKYNNGPKAVKIMKSLVPQKVAIHDVYVPYVFLHPERIITEKKTITSSEDGTTMVLPGEKHEIVTGFDIPHFKKFIKEYIR